MRRGFLLAALVLTVAARAEAQDHYALEILAPRDDLPTHHRMTRAYPGVPWEVRVAAVGGDWPYTYSLAGQSVIHACDVTKDEGVLRLTENVIINAQKAAGPCPARCCART